MKDQSKPEEVVADVILSVSVLQKVLQEPVPEGESPRRTVMRLAEAFAEVYQKE